MSRPDADAVMEDIRRLWESRPEDDVALSAEAFEILDRATALRRTSAGTDWAMARLAEGFARFLVARQTAAWGHRSYTIQALEAALDGLRDAAASLPSAFCPAPDAVLSFRSALLVHWQAVQSEPDLSRIADLPFHALRPDF